MDEPEMNTLTQSNRWRGFFWRGVAKESRAHWFLGAAKAGQSPWPCAWRAGKDPKPGI